MKCGPGSTTSNARALREACSMWVLWLRERRTVCSLVSLQTLRHAFLVRSQRSRKRRPGIRLPGVGGGDLTQRVDSGSDGEA